MKVHVTLAVLFTLCFTEASHAADWIDGYYMSQSLDTCFNAANRYLGETEYGYAPRISLVGTFLFGGESYPFVKYFEPNENYVIIAGGDDDAIDVDVRIKDMNGNVIAEDTALDETAVIEFNSGRGGQLRIEAELYESESDESFVTFVVLQEGGWYIPRDEFDIAKETMFEMCRGANNAAVEDGRSVYLNAEAGQAALFGGLLGGEEGTMLTNLSFGDGDMMVVAAGDSDVQDIDLVLYDDNDRELTADRLPDAHPVISYTSSDQESYKVNITSEATQESIPTYCIVGLLQISDAE